MYQSPRIRRLHNDLAALERLRSESSVFRFTAHGDPPQQYRISFQGQRLMARPRQGQSSRASRRDQAGCVLSADHARSSAGSRRSITPISPRSAWSAWEDTARTGCPACSSTSCASCSGTCCGITITTFGARTTAMPRSGSPARRRSCSRPIADRSADLRAALGRVESTAEGGPALSVHASGGEGIGQVSRRSASGIDPPRSPGSRKFVVAVLAGSSARLRRPNRGSRDRTASERPAADESRASRMLGGRRSWRLNLASRDRPTIRMNGANLDDHQPSPTSSVPSSSCRPAQRRDRIHRMRSSYSRASRRRMDDHTADAPRPAFVGRPVEA